MKSIHWVLGVGLLGMLSVGPCSAQMSTFPPPPPLAPKPVSNPPPNNSSPTSANPDFGIPTQNGAGNGTSSSSGTTSSGTGEQLPETAGLLNSMSALDDKITLQPSDRISFRVIEDKDPAVPREVTDTGEVDFPYVGRVKVQGKTCHQVAVELKGLLEIDYYKHATVIVGLDVIADRDKDKVKPHDYAWIVGQVRQVGSQEVIKDQPLTVSQMILRAGGFGDFADQRKVRVIHRSGSSVEPPGDIPPETEGAQNEQIIDVKAIFDGQSKVDPVVRPNDYIIVSKRLVNL
jgi:polysaccharide export outer membrane protein